MRAVSATAAALFRRQLCGPWVRICAHAHGAHEPTSGYAKYAFPFARRQDSERWAGFVMANTQEARILVRRKYGNPPVGPPLSRVPGTPRHEEGHERGIGGAHGKRRRGLHQHVNRLL